MSKALSSAKRRRGFQPSLSTQEQSRRPDNRSQKSSRRSISTVLQTHSSRINSLEVGIPSAFAKCKKDMNDLFQNTSSLSTELNNLRGNHTVDKLDNTGLNDIKHKQKELEDKQVEIIEKLTFIDDKINSADDMYLVLNTKLEFIDSKLHDYTTVTDDMGLNDKIITVGEKLHDYNNIMLSKITLLENRLADRYLYKSVDDLRNKLETSNTKIENLNRIVNCNKPNKNVLSDIQTTVDNNHINESGTFLAQCTTGNFWCIPTSSDTSDEFEVTPTPDIVAATVDTVVSKEVSDELIIVKSGMEDDDDMPTFPTINN